MHIAAGIALGVASFVWLLFWSLISTNPIAPGKADLLPMSVGLVGSFGLAVAALLVI